MAGARRLRFHCGVCDASCRLKTLECPSCGSNNIRMAITTSTGSTVSAPARSLSFSVTAPPKRRVRTTIKYEYSTERRQVEIVERTFDKLEDKYHEVYWDLEGDVVFEKHRDRDDQSAHGERGKAPGAGTESPFEAILRILPHLPPDHPALTEIPDQESPPPPG
jgi:hypothetical protein